MGLADSPDMLLIIVRGEHKNRFSFLVVVPIARRPRNSTLSFRQPERDLRAFSADKYMLLPLLLPPLLFLLLLLLLLLLFGTDAAGDPEDSS